MPFLLPVFACSLFSYIPWLAISGWRVQSSTVQRFKVPHKRKAESGLCHSKFDVRCSMFPIPQFQHFSISAFQLFPAAPHSRFKVQGSKFNGSKFSGSKFSGSRFSGSKFNGSKFKAPLSCRLPFRVGWVLGWRTLATHGPPVNANPCRSAGAWRTRWHPWPLRFLRSLLLVHGFGIDFPALKTKT